MQNNQIPNDQPVGAAPAAGAQVRKPRTKKTHHVVTLLIVVAVAIVVLGYAALLGLDALTKS
jgi:hypothetical protein